MLRGDDITVIVTTSPGRCDPSLELIQTTLESFRRVNLHDCTVLIVADEFSEESPGKQRSQRNGKVLLPQLIRYQERLQKLSSAIQDGEEWASSCRLIELKGWHGFGKAVQAALEMVVSPFVCVVQHDLVFAKEMNLFPLLQILRTNADVNCITLLRSKTVNYAQVIQTRCHIDIGPHITFSAITGGRVDKSAGTESEVDGDVSDCHVVNLQQLPQFFDSTHIAKTGWYRDLLSSPLPNGKCLRQGEFIEDFIGSFMLNRSKSTGTASSVAEYGVWLYDDGSNIPMVHHLDGRKFMSRDDSFGRMVDSSKD